MFILADIDSNGHELVNDKPTGVNPKWRQPAKTINHEGPKKAQKEDAKVDGLDHKSINCSVSN